MESLLFKRETKINDGISIIIPTVEEVLRNEQKYYSLISAFTAMPIDLMVQLDDAGIDFETINEYELFLLLFPSLKGQDTSLIFGDLDLSKFKMAINEENETIALVDKENDVVIDRAIHGMIAKVLRKIHHIEKDVRKPGNQAAKEFMIKRARDKLKRKKKEDNSQLESLIVAMVNTEQYKYNFETTKGLTIYQFNESVRQIIKKVEYDKRMIGVYAGTVSTKDLSQDDLNWLTHK